MSELKNYWGRPVADKVAALGQLGILVDRHEEVPYERIYIHLADEPWSWFAIDAAGNVTLDLIRSHDSYGIDLRSAAERSRVRVVLEAVQELVSDLYGCECHLALLEELRMRGWHGYERSFGEVFVGELTNEYSLEATVFGWDVKPSTRLEMLDEFSARRLGTRLKELKRDVAAIHAGRGSGVAGDIGHYIELIERVGR